MTGSALAIDAVLFDFGGVLAEEGFRAGLYAIARLNGLDPVTVHRQGIDAIYGCGCVAGRAEEADFRNVMRSRFSLNIVHDRAVVSAVPEVRVRHPQAKVTHEAAIGSVDSKQLESLMARGLAPEEAVDLIVKGMLA
jgi:hypothetical protein